MSLLAEGIASCKALLEQLSTAPLYLARLGNDLQAVTLEQGYVPLLVDYTEEDSQAKGLRAFRDGQGKQPSVYFSALERVNQAPLLVLQGPAGSGKSVFARYLAAHLAGHWLDDSHYTLARLQRGIPRNEQGVTRAQDWSGAIPLPLYVPAPEAGWLADVLGRDDHFARRWLDSGTPLLLILDNAQRLEPTSLFAEVEALCNSYPNVRLLLLGAQEQCSNWSLPVRWQRQALLPLLTLQRTALINEQWPELAQAFAATGDAALLSTPAAFGLAMAVGDAVEGGGALDLAERWFRIFSTQTHPDQRLLESRYLQGLLAASALRHRRGAELAELLADDPLYWAAPLLQLGLQLLREGQPPTDLVHALLGSSPVAEGVLLVSRLYQHWPVAPEPERLTAALLHLVTDGTVSLAHRVAAGRALGRWGDPRDLQQLCPVAAGELTMGSTTHPNSQPLHRVWVEAFQIGRYPVTNALYLDFVSATQHSWRSEQGREAERANAPAVDLTWHDAQAFCAWLTVQWREQGRIGVGQRVRLPTEIEWEYAARGDQSGEGYVYPWGGPWQPGRSNGEEASLNDTCSVGLFPEGRSVWGCDDLCGQVWEWTTTLWGKDMAQPTWTYPYADDGRENLLAPAAVRRVLRGGCFSSPREKACVSYRGSLEPQGFWRGNGFRVVVSD